MNAENELFGELHEQEENGLFGNEHRRQYEAQQEALRLSDASSTFICDVCDCEHDKNYKCEKCSGKAYINTQEDVCGNITSEWVYAGDVCGNCCNCH